MQKKKIVPRQFIPQHKSHLIEVTQKYQDAQSTQNSSFISHDSKSQQRKKRQNHYFKSLSQAAESKQQNNFILDFSPDVTNISYFSQFQQTQNETKPQTNQKQRIINKNIGNQTQINTFYKNQVSEKYRKTHKSAFQGPTRDALQQYEQRHQSYQPGPGEYNINSVFVGKEQDILKQQQQQLLHQQIDSLNITNNKVEDVDENANNNNYINNNKSFNNSIDQTLCDVQNYKQISQIYKKIKDVVKDLSQDNNLNSNNGKVNNPKIDEAQLEENSIQQKKNDLKNQRMQYMFMKDDRDRFGQQVFPLAGRDKTPGPNYYFTDNYSLEYKKNKIISLEKQKQQLKQWLHPNNINF